MKIATLNIDWAKKYKSKTHYLRIEKYLNQFDFDFLILTESINVNLQNFYYKYFSTQIPENIIYEKLNYSDYLKGEKAFRIGIYSKTKAYKQFKVIDRKTSLALEFETEFGNLVFYSTIIGTRYKEKPFVKTELENCIKDCNELFKQNKNLFIIGDLNTSFLDYEKEFTINLETTDSLKNLFSNLNLSISTVNIEKNIDHIIIPNSLIKYLKRSEVFVEKEELSDHKGIFIELQPHFC